MNIANILELDIDDILTINYELLLVRKTLIFPNIGVFRLLSLPREYNIHYFRFENKQYKIDFNRDPDCENDELFVLYSQKYKTEDKYFKDSWSSIVNSLKEKIKKYEKCSWYNIGYFYLSDDEILFHKNDTLTVSSKLYSHNLIPLSPIVDYGKEPHYTYTKEPDNKANEAQKVDTPLGETNAKEKNDTTEEDKIEKPSTSKEKTKKFNLKKDINTVLFYDENVEEVPSIKVEQDEYSQEKDEDKELNFNNLEFKQNTPKAEIDKEEEDREATSTENVKVDENAINQEVTDKKINATKNKTKWTKKKFGKIIILYIILGFMVASIIFYFFLYNFSFVKIQG